MWRTNQKMSYKKHQRFNDILSIVVVFVALYILVLPFVPQLTLWWQKRNDKTQGYVYQTRLTEDPAVEEVQAPIPEGKRLVLPTIQLDEEVHEGEKFWTLSKGLWRRPNTSTPDRGGNTVIVGHRFTYNGPAQFYHLDKIQIGDKFPLYWEGVEYDYEVFDISVVSALEVSVESPTDDPILTIYTCTPLWSAKDRLVIKSRLLEDGL